MNKLLPQELERSGHYMKIGFLTNCLTLPLTEKVEFAQKIGFNTLEIACWPLKNGLLHSGCDIDVKNFSCDQATELKNHFEKNNISIAALSYYDNMLHQDTEIRIENQRHLRDVIKVAEKLGISLVGTFVGKNFSMSIKENFELYKKIFTPLVDYAGEHNVSLMIENCPMPSWSQEGLPSTISYSPEFWDEMFSIIPSKNFGLNFDPSHLYWMQIDYIKCIKSYSDRIFHVHANDLKINPELKTIYSFYGKKINKTNYKDMGWYIPKAPGLGEIKWPEVIKTLRSVSYDGCITIEYKDQTLSGADIKVMEGLNYSYNYLKHIIETL